MKKNLYLTAFSLLGIFLLGCTASSSASSGGLTVSNAPGVQIKEFYISCSDNEAGKCKSIDTTPGMPVYILLQIANNAEDPIKNVHAELYNTAELNTSRTNMIQTWPEIVPNGVEEISWFLEVPKIVSVSTKYQPLVRACYGFNTDAVRDILIANSQDANLPTPSAPVSSQAPVSISFSWSGNYVPITGKSTNIKVKISKDADGFVANSYDSPDSFGTKDTLANLTIWWGNPKSFKVSVASAGDFDECHVEDEITLCTITDVNKLKLFNQKERSYNVFITIEDINDDENYEGTLKMHATTFYKFCVFSDPLVINVNPLVQ